ncbi:MAG: VCBS repeat-containing protein, partial [Armatimonadota bacterium]
MRPIAIFCVIAACLAGSSPGAEGRSASTNMSVASAVSEAEYFRWEGVVRPSDEPAGLAFRAGQGGDRYWAILESARLRIGRTLDGKEQVFGEHIAPQAKRLCLAVEVVPAQQDENGPAWYIGSALSPPAIEIRAKTWPDTEPEPDWQLSVTSDPFVPGQYGEAYWDIPSTSARYPFGGRLSVIGALHSVREVRFERLAFAPSEAPQHVAPCATIQLGPNGGSWLALGDLDNDGRLDFLSARNDNQSVTALVAVDPEGEVLWQRGGGGRPDIGYDVPCTIYDLNGDGKTEVLYSSEGDLIVLEGATGREIRRHALPDGLRAADCIVLADLRGLGRRQDVVIKDRYAKVYAYTAEFEPLWRWEGNTGHH